MWASSRTLRLIVFLGWEAGVAYYRRPTSTAKPLVVTSRKRGSRMIIETALLSFALTTIVLPPQLPPKAPKKPAMKIAQVQQDPRFTNFAKGVLHCYHPTA